ncbi:MAG TPA: hypothetical protein VNQ90_14635 [Chthoniobacteraceae bacterium]|nr:hypothetical protein [Chthoniobacteraceae bacterium]
MNTDPSTPSALFKIRSPLLRFFRTLGCAGLLLGAALPAGHAQTLLDPAYVQTFDGANGTLPTNWDVFTNGARVFAEQNGAGSLNVGNRNTTDSGNTGTVFFTGDVGTVTGGVFGDVSVEVVFSPHTSGNWVGVVGRAQGSSSWNPNGYYALLNANSGFMGIWSAAPANATAEQIDNALASVALPALASNTPYRLILEMEGTRLTASLYSLEAEVGTDDPLATVSVINSLYFSGVTGVHARHGGANRLTSYDTFSITVIPEPSVALLGGLALGIGFLLFRVNRQRSKTGAQS